MELVDLEYLADTEDVLSVKELIAEHLELTGSRIARRVLEDWESEVHKFVRVMPIPYREALKLASPRRLYTKSMASGVPGVNFETNIEKNIGQGGIHG